MGLQEYHRKRSFTETPEPKGKTRKSGRKLRFVVQKHAATRLHYDFRLELGGVLVSWAIPKGPSLSPDDKRLAMKVEDHPFDYRTFEGTIPAGQYGAGTVMVWDEGWFEPYEEYTAKDQEKVLRHGIHRGDLKVVLHGKKLKGAWAIVRAKSFGENSWLMIKKQDDGVSTQDVTELDRSAKTGKSMAEISGKPEIDLSDARKARMPKDVKPMLATLTREAFDRKDWLFEIKWDGYRAISEVKKGKVVMYSRNDIDFTERYEPVVNELADLGHDAVLDGEVVALDAKGRSRFQLLQQYHKTGKGNLAYFVFDILYLDGHDLTGLPLIRRKEILKAVLTHAGKSVHYSDHIEERGTAFFAAAKRQQLEGVMAKDGASTYETGRRSRSWLKVKTGNRQEVVITGFTEPRGSRKRFGALVLGMYEQGELRYVGHVGTGFDDALLESLYRTMKPLAQKTCPFETEPPSNAPVTWLKPELVCEVAFTEWTDDGNLRHPAFVGLREDKLAEQVHPEHVKTDVREETVKIGKRPVHLTHLEKVYWPKDGYTKGDLIAYYRDISKTILPYLKDRPESLNRHPHGIDGDSFYQKDLENHPSWVKTKKIHSESNDKDIHWLLCQDEATLAYMANLGCIELNPWHSRVGTLNKPDYLLIDLDAKTTTFERIIEVAKEVKKLLDELGLKSFPKTSGKTGLHICIPLGAKYSYEQAKQFDQILMRLVHDRLPKITSVERNPEKRKGEVYLDFLQNRRGQTMAAAYCVRPVPGATVSTPLEWSEVRKGLDPKKFTIKTTGKRLEKKGDLWKGVLGSGVDLKKALGRIEQLS
jgi:bifunctional non-homologous end joining protein LigD